MMLDLQRHIGLMWFLRRVGTRDCLAWFVASEDAISEGDAAGAPQSAVGDLALTVSGEESIQVG